MCNRFLPILLLSLIGAGFSTSVCADDYQSHDEIYTAVKSYISNELSEQDSRISVRRLDDRLRLKRCGETLDIFWAPGARHAGATSIGVSCNAAKPWKIYVRVDIAVTREILVATRLLRRGDIMGKADFELERRDISRLGDRYLSDASRFIGYEVAQDINAGQVLTARMLRQPKWVKRGQRVTLIAGVSGLEVKMSGEAMSDGAKGAIIRVKNSSSKKIVQGEVVEKGVVKVLM